MYIETIITHRIYYLLGIAPLHLVNIFLGGMAMSGDYYRLLARRAHAFLSLAEDLLGKGEYDLAVFNAEQAVQLRLKAIIYRLWGVTPRSHSVRWLLGLMRNNLLRAGLVQAAERIDEFTRTHRSLLAALEDAYTLTRYGHLEYDHELASELVSVAKKLWSLLEEVERLATNMGEASIGEA